MNAQATLQTTHAALEMSLEETLDIRGAGFWADTLGTVGQVIGTVVDTTIAVSAAVS